MRFGAFRSGEREGLGVGTSSNGHLRGLFQGDSGYPGTLDSLVRKGCAALNAAAAALEKGEEIDTSNVTFLQPLSAPGKIICVGLNYVSKESSAVDHGKEL
jgi:acylpyruvate hydrolase